MARKVRSLAVTVFTVFALAQPSTVSAELADGAMSCQVTGSTIMRSNEGRSETYAYATGEFEIGDTLKLTYDVSATSVSLGMFDQKRSQGGERNWQHLNILYRTGVGAADTWVTDDNNKGGIYDKGSTIAIGTDSIISRNLLTSIELERYYKSDWHGMLHMNFSPNLAHQIATLDCRTEKDGITDVLQVLKQDAGKRTK